MQGIPGGRRQGDLWVLVTKRGSEHVYGHFITASVSEFEIDLYHVKSNGSYWIHYIFPEHLLPRLVV